MSYITLAALQLAIPEQTLIWLTDDDAIPLTVNEAVVTEAIQQADEIIDAHLRARYTLPLTPVPTVVRHIATQLARHWLYSRRPEGAGLPDAVKTGYQGAMDILRALRDGKIQLGVEEDQSSQPASAGVLVSAPERLFSDDVLSQF